MNLGASTVWDGSTSPTNCNGSSTNCNSGNTWIGNYYQRGRNEPVNNSTTVSVYSGSFSGLLGHNNFVFSDGTYGDWWQNEAGNTTPTRWSGTNPQGPCPSGWHVPSRTDWQTACNTISGTSCANNATTISVLKSTLKLPHSGTRSSSNSYYYDQSVYARYWSSTPTSYNAYYVRYDSSAINVSAALGRAQGATIRCIKN